MSQITEHGGLIWVKEVAVSVIDIKVRHLAPDQNFTQRQQDI